MNAAPQPGLDASYTHCRQVVQEQAKNFSYAFLLLPAAKRRALEAIYAYCRVADDFADDDGIPTEERAVHLADLRARLRREFPRAGDPPPPDLRPAPDLDLLMTALRDAAVRFGIRREDLDEVAIGCEQDLTVTRYETFEDLHGYCYMVASAVGLACLEVFGYRADADAVRAMAVDLGIAMQLTNIIRDVREDMERDRIYLPLEDLRRYGISEDQLRAKDTGGLWRDLLAFQVQRARCYFARGKRLARFVDRNARVCPLALASIYEGLLGQIERADYDVFSSRVSLSSRRKLGLLGLAMGRGLVGV